MMITINIYGWGSLEVHPAHAQQLKSKGSNKFANGLTRCKIPTAKMGQQVVVYLPETTVSALLARYVIPAATTAQAVLQTVAMDTTVMDTTPVDTTPVDALPVVAPKKRIATKTVA